MNQTSMKKMTKKNRLEQCINTDFHFHPHHDVIQMINPNVIISRMYTNTYQHIQDAIRCTSPETTISSHAWSYNR